MTSNADLRALLGRPDFRRLLAVRLVGQFGDGVFQVAVAAYVLFSPERQPDAASIAFALAAVLLPFSLLGPFAGVLLDRWPRRQVLLYANLTRALPAVITAYLVSSGAAEWWLFVAVVVAFGINRFLLSALSASLPHVVDAGQLLVANSVTPTAGTLTFFIGIGTASAFRSLLPWPVHDGQLAAIAAGCFAVAGLLALRLMRRQLGPAHRDVTAVRAQLSEVFSGLLAGIAHVRSRPVAGHALAAIAAQRFWYGLSTVVTILLYRNYLNPPADAGAGLAGLSVAVLVSGLGYFAAAALTPVATAQLGTPTWIVVLLLTAGVVMAFPGGLFTNAALLVAAFVLGIAAQGVKICVDTLVQVHIDDEFRGRVFSLYDVAFNLVFVAAAAVGALIIPAQGKSYAVLTLVSVGYAATGVVYARLAHHDSSSSLARSGPSGPSSSRRLSKNS